MEKIVKKKTPFIFPVIYTVASLAMLLYSYTQVDLGLTLTQQSIIQTIQKAFQYIGYFERPLSTLWFLVLLAIFFGLYVVMLSKAVKGTLGSRELWMIILPMTGIIVFSYPAFSYDLFNYMFDAKTILLYHKIPYLVTPLQFTGFEPWLAFMHWTHVSSIYTPLWLLISLVPYFFGFGYFLWIMWNFKIFMAVFYLLTVYFIQKILHSTYTPKEAILGTAVFALNPLIIIESLVSAHNDIVMMGLCIVAVYFYQSRQKIYSFFFFALSIAVKWMTLFLLPSFFFGCKRRLMLFLMSAGFIFILFYTKREVLSWYFIWFMPLIALLSYSQPLIIVSIGISMGLLLRYAPFLYYGHWNDPVPLIKEWVTVIPIVLSCIIALFLRFKKVLANP